MAKLFTLFIIVAVHSATATITSCSISNVRTGTVLVDQSASPNCSTGIPDSGVFEDQQHNMSSIWYSTPGMGDALRLESSGLLGLRVGSAVTGTPADYDCTEESCDPLRVVSTAEFAVSRHLRSMFTNASGSGYIDVAPDVVGGDSDGTGGTAEGTVEIELRQGSTSISAPGIGTLSLNQPFDIYMSAAFSAQGDTRVLGSSFYQQLWTSLMLRGYGSDGQLDPTARIAYLTEIPEPSTFLQSLGSICCVWLCRSVLAATRRAG